MTGTTPHSAAGFQQAMRTVTLSNGQQVTIPGQPNDSAPVELPPAPSSTQRHMEALMKQRRAKPYGDRFDFQAEVMAVVNEEDPEGTAERVQNWFASLNVAELRHVLDDSWEALETEAREDLESEGWHQPGGDDCTDGCTEEHVEDMEHEEKPDYIAGRTVAILTDYHDKHHGLSLWAACTREPCVDFGEFRTAGYQAVHA